jgi:hypothetical protein
MSVMIEVFSCMKCPARVECLTYSAALTWGFGNKPLDEYRLLAGCPHSKRVTGRERKEIYTLEEVFEHVHCGLQPRKGVDMAVFDGDAIDMCSRRYHVFKDKGVTCCECGIKGVFFAKERTPSDKGKLPNKWHLELYALDGNGREVIMTKDHILPKSKGGKDYIDNLRTMCFYCNCKRGNGDGK